MCVKSLFWSFWECSPFSASWPLGIAWRGLCSGWETIQGGAGERGRGGGAVDSQVLRAGEACTMKAFQPPKGCFPGQEEAAWSRTSPRDLIHAGTLCCV